MGKSAEALRNAKLEEIQRNTEKNRDNPNFFGNPFTGQGIIIGNKEAPGNDPPAPTYQDTVPPPKEQEHAPKGGPKQASAGSASDYLKWDEQYNEQEYPQTAAAFRKMGLKKPGDGRNTTERDANDFAALQAAIVNDTNEKAKRKPADRRLVNYNKSPITDADRERVKAQSIAALQRKYKALEPNRWERPEIRKEAEAIAEAYGIELEPWD